jgi:hypothetical protein
MEKFIFSKTFTKVFKRSTNCACGKSAVISALNIRTSDATDGLDLLCIFCLDCATRGIRKLPPCSWLQIVEWRREYNLQNPIRRTYKVYSLNERHNRADFVIIDGSNQFLCGQRLTTRLDVIPQYSRTIDATFEVGGTPLEIGLFEHSGSD